jgi:hypothetical protein
VGARAPRSCQPLAEPVRLQLLRLPSAPASRCDGSLPAGVALRCPSTLSVNASRFEIPFRGRLAKMRTGGSLSRRTSRRPHAPGAVPSDSGGVDLPCVGGKLAGRMLRSISRAVFRLIARCGGCVYPATMHRISESIAADNTSRINFQKRAGKSQITRLLCHGDTAGCADSTPQTRYVRNHRRPLARVHEATRDPCRATTRAGNSAPGLVCVCA